MLEIQINYSWIDITEKANAKWNQAAEDKTADIDLQWNTEAYGKALQKEEDEEFWDEDDLYWNYTLTSEVKENDEDAG